MRTLLLMAGVLAAVFCSVLSARAQGSPVTVETCRVLVDQHGVPEHGPVLTFQGGSQQAEQVAVCQSLARAAARAGIDAERLFATWADTDANGALDTAEVAAYFTAVRSGEPLSLPTPVEAAESSTTVVPPTTALAGEAAAPSSPRVARGWLLPLIAAIAFAITALLLVRAQRSARRQR